MNKGKYVDVIYGSIVFRTVVVRFRIRIGVFAIIVVTVWY